MVVYEVGSLEKYILALKRNKFTVVKYSTTWCAPCKKITPLFEKLSEEDAYKSVLFLEVDCEEAEDVAMDERVSSFPTFKFFKQGVLFEMFTGADESRLKKKLRALIESN